ncbi:unnamed protein product [Lathyrus sativus]|nr:unnamed protein product [Lathyrus sativus]
MGCWVGFDWKWNICFPSFPAGSEMERELVCLNDLLLNVKPSVDKFDSFNWVLMANNIFSVSSCYDCIIQNIPSPKISHVLKNALSTMWASNLPSNIQVFLGKLFRNCVATKDQLVRRRICIVGDSLDCHLCGNALESIHHVFLACDFSVKVWEGVVNWCGLGVDTFVPCIESFVSFGNTSSKFVGTMRGSIFWALTVWHIWQSRNQLIFKGISASVDDTINKVKFFSCRWHNGGEKSSKYLFYDWYVEPLDCISQK